MGNNHLISVIIPVYQAEGYICNCLQSLVEQDLEDFELVLVNDGTKDRSIELADEFLSDKKIDYRIIHKENGGQASARNLGVLESKGKYIVFVDSDDAVCPEYLATLYDNIVSSDCRVAIANYQTVTEKTLFNRPQQIFEPNVMSRKEISDRFLTRRINIVVTSMIIEKEEFVNKALWFDESVRFGEDFFFYWRLLASQDRVVYNKTPVYNYFVRGGSTTTSVNVEKMLTNIKALPRLYADLEGVFGKKMSKFVISRQKFAMLRVGAMFGNYCDYMEIYRALDFNAERRKLLGFPDVRVKLLVASLYVYKRVFYIVNHN